MQGEIYGSRSRLVMRDLAEQDQQCSEKRLVECKNKGRDGGGAGEVPARSGAASPEEQAEDGDESHAARGAVGELDEGGGGGVVLNDRAIAERPVISAACAGAGGAYGCSRKNDGDVVDKDSPGGAIQR